MDCSPNIVSPTFITGMLNQRCCVNNLHIIHVSVDLLQAFMGLKLTLPQQINVSAVSIFEEKNNKQYELVMYVYETNLKINVLQMSDVEKGEDPPRHRTNGWNQPPHPCQLGVWACILKFGIIYYFVLAPAIQAQLQPIVCTVSFIG